MSGYYWGSNIKQKKRPCRLCGRPSVIFSDGRCKYCAGRQDTKPIGSSSRPPKVMTNWFEEHRPLMTGVCAHCGGPSLRDDDQLFRFSLAHILPKRLGYFSSVMDHPDNYIELCYWSPSCHDNFDHGRLKLENMNCIDLIIERFLRMYPAIEESERARIPEFLMQFVPIDI